MKSHLQVWTCRGSKGSIEGRLPGPNLASHVSPVVGGGSLAPGIADFIKLVRNTFCLWSFTKIVVTTEQATINIIALK